MLPAEESASPTARTGGMAADLSIDISMPPTRNAPADARRAVQRSLGELLAPRVLEDVLLVVSELVTNAVLHGHGSVALQLAYDGTHIAGTVSDHGDGFTDAAGKHDPTRGGGRGLDLVDQLTSRWGLHQTTSRVWFELSVDLSR
jgi:anti-sigma regulatory factor (Ser/Thr protein kinase)